MTSYIAVRHMAYCWITANYSVKYTLVRNFAKYGHDFDNLFASRVCSKFVIKDPNIPQNALLHYY